MNIIWSNQNKTMQAQFKKKESFESGLDTLFILRNELMDIFFSLKKICRTMLLPSYLSGSQTEITVFRLPGLCGIFSE